METPREPFVVLESKPLEISEEFESRRVMEENIIAALMDNNISSIGIDGAGGIGKTRMARRIGERVKREKLFKVVVMVTVGPSSDLNKVAYEISDYLSVEVEGGDYVARANDLLSKLVMKERVLIILDDVWRKLNLEKMEPLEKLSGSYKVMVTSRSKSVCLAMGCDQVFTVQGLTEDDIYFRFSNSPGLNISGRSQRLAIAATDSGGMLTVKSKLLPDFVAGKNLTSYIFALQGDFSGTRVGNSPGFNFLARSFAGDVAEALQHESKYADFPPLTYFIVTGESNSKDDIGSHSIKNYVISALRFLSSALQELDLREADIQELPQEMKEMTNLRLLNLTNCRNLQIIEPGLISSLVRLEKLYMLGSFSEWEVEKEGKRGVNATINELDYLPNLTALQIQIQDPGIISKSSRIWSRLTVFVILTPDELKCRYEESLDVSFPAVNLDDYYWQFQRAMDLYLPNVTLLMDWISDLLRSAEFLCLKGDGSKNAVDELIPDGFKLLKQLNLGHCNTMEYLVNGVDQVLPLNGFFPFLESLCLEDLLLFKEIFNGEIPAGLFAELRNLKLYKLPALLHLCRSKTQGVSLSNLRSVHISHCPKLRSLFSLSMARDLLQLEEIKIEYCEMMEEVFSEEMCEDGKISNNIHFSRLSHIELDTLPHLTDFCKNVVIEFPQLRNMRIQSLRKLRTLCSTDCDLPSEGNDGDGIQFLFNEKVAFGSLKKLEIEEMDSMTGIWCRQTSASLFCELEVLVVSSCDTLSNLFSNSIAKNLVQLKHLRVEDCLVMRVVIAEDGEIGEPETNESLFPRLRKLELQRLPVLESFCHMMNGLELPLLGDFILYDCPEMKEFSGGEVHFPVLGCVKKDISIYKIDGGSYSIQRLFNEKKLFMHQSRSFPSQYQVAEVKEVMEEEVMEESVHSYLACSSQASGGNRSLQNAMNEKELELEHERLDEDDPMSQFCVGRNDVGVQIEEINDEATHLEDFILFCSIFPSDYEFTKDILVWQWIAAGLIVMGEDEIMEKACTKHFDTLLGMDYIVASRYDHFIDQMKYKIGDGMTTFFQKKQLEPKFRNFLDSRQPDVAKVEHLSLAFEQIGSMKFQVLKQHSCLQTLIINRCYGSKINHLPSDVFLELKMLKILILSHTNIVELPSSVEHLKELRFLDMSETPICWLPETICCFSSLHTIKLDGCLSLRGLPKCTSKLINLRHLVLDVVRQLQSMPTGIGNLSKLRTLTAFLVGEDDGCQIGELKDMNKLRGSLRVLSLENVRIKEEAEEACLFNKRDLKKIELQWNDLQDEKNIDEEEVLASLQPPFGIQELKILFYSGGVFPSWISNPLFSELVKIILYRCRYCCSLPSLGELPSLKQLTIIENNEVTEIDGIFRRKQTNKHHVAFPKLEKLSIDSMSKLEKWTGLENGDFSSLRHLIIEDCPKFVGLPFLSRLNSLWHLEISYCPELSCLPEEGLPSTLESLMIKDCPKLKVRCCNEQCDDWSKVACVPGFYIDNQKLCPQL